MKLSRRQAIRSVALGVGASAPLPGADTAVSLGALRSASSLNGVALDDQQLRVVQPVIEQRRPQIERLRAFEVGDLVAPTEGILDR